MRRSELSRISGFRRSSPTLASPKREELFGPLGIKVRPALQTDHAQEAMKHDGVRPDTILELVEG